MSDQRFIVKEQSGEGPWDRRWILVDPVSGEILDDAHGYGFKSPQKAARAGWYKFLGGREKKDKIRVDAHKFWRSNPEFLAEVETFEMDFFKEICRGEVSLEVELRVLAEARGVVGFDLNFLEYRR